MKTSPAACDLEAATPVPASSTAKAAKKVTREEVVDPRLRSAFVRKQVYFVLSLQFTLTAAIAATVYFVRPVQRFFADGPPAAVVPAFVVMIISPQIVCEVMFPELDDGEKRPMHLVLIALVRVCCSLTLALSAFTTDVDIAFLQAAILIVLGLTLCTIWAAKRDLNYDHSNTFAALLTSVIVPLAYTIVVIPFPLKMVGIAICGFLVTLVLSGFYVVTCESCDSLVFSATTATTMYNGGGGGGSEDNGDNHRV